MCLTARPVATITTTATNSLVFTPQSYLWMKRDYRKLNANGPRRKRAQECARSQDPPLREVGDSHACSRNPASLAVARNWGIGSSCLNAEVKALLRLHIVRG